MQSKPFFLFYHKTNIRELFVVYQPQRKKNSTGYQREFIIAEHKELAIYLYCGTNNNKTSTQNRQLNFRSPKSRIICFKVEIGAGLLKIKGLHRLIVLPD
jgi:hypothetical protein